MNWTRTGPWLPWMRLGNKPGMLYYTGHVLKVESFDELPEDVRAATIADFP